MFSLFPLHFLLAEEKDEEQVVKEEEVVEKEEEDVEIGVGGLEGEREAGGERQGNQKYSG